MEIELLRTDDYISGMVQKYSDMILRLALAYLKNMPDAQDACQNVFIKLFEKSKTFADSEHEKAWIIRVTVNICKDMLRSQWRKRFLPFEKAGGGNSVHLPIKDRENREVVSLVLELPVKYRVIIHLHYFENYSTYEIAKLLNRNASTVRTQLRRARELLRAKMIGGFDNENE